MLLLTQQEMVGNEQSRDINSRSKTNVQAAYKSLGIAKDFRHSYELSANLSV